MLEGLWVALEETPETYRRNNPRTLPGIKEYSERILEWWKGKAQHRRGSRRSKSGSGELVAYFVSRPE